MEASDERDQSGQQHGDGDNAGGDVVQGDKVEVGEVVAPESPAESESPAGDDKE